MRSAVLEVCASVWSKRFPREGRNSHQHDSYCVAARMKQLYWPSLARREAACRLTRSIAKAKDNLSKLVDEAVAGEEVAITRHGKVVA